jgi:hypothetical protein
MAADYDSPWKEALDRYFEVFLALLFPHIHRLIDWSRGYESLDKEFQQVVREAEVGRRYVDKLVKVWTLDGVECWVLIHVEIQTTREAEFPRRMYVYNYRVFDRYNRAVASLAVLADDDPDWRPGEDRSGEPQARQNWCKCVRRTPLRRCGAELGLGPGRRCKWRYSRFRGNAAGTAQYRESECE